MTAEERAAMRAERAAAAEDGGTWLEEAMGAGGGLEGLVELLAADGAEAEEAAAVAGAAV
jgi:hypothetical protein